MAIVVTSNFETKPAPAPSKEAAAPVETKEAIPAAAEKLAETLETSGSSNEVKNETEVAAEAAATQERPKAKKGYKKTIDKLNKRLADAERENAYLRGNADAKKNPDGPKPEVKIEASTAGEPDADKFESHGEYLKALTKWQIAEDKKADSLKTREASAIAEQSKQVEKLKTSIAGFKGAHADFDEVMESVDDIPLPRELSEAFLDSENPAELMYELAKNRAEYEKICALPASQRARALGRFEAKLEPKAEATQTASGVKQASKAPPPISPVGNKGTGAGKKSLSDPNLTQREYEAMRLEQIKSRSSSW